MKLTLRILIVACLSFSSWSGGVTFEEIQTEGLDLARGVTITVFAMLSLGIGYGIVKEMRRR